MIKVYISSTYEDLKEYRAAVIKALGLKKNDVQIAAMEHYTAADDRPLDHCLRDVRSSDVYVGIFARWYGFRPTEGNPDNLSITELELRAALDAGKRVLCFRLDPKVDWPEQYAAQGADKEALATLLQRVTSDRIVPAFASKDDLVGQVMAAVDNTRQRSSSVIPPIAPIMCDRTSQTGAFTNRYDTLRDSGKATPQIYMVVGSEEQCPQSLVRRLLEHVKINPPKLGRGDAVVHSLISCRWPDEGDLELRSRDLLQSLFVAFRKALFDAGDTRHDAGTLDAKSLVKMVGGAPYSCYPVQYLIYADTWRSVRPLMERHLAFWDGIDATGNPPLFLVFFKIILPSPKQGLAQKIFSWVGAKPVLIDKDFLKPGDQKPYCPLPDLDSVIDRHVSEWHDEYPVFPTSQAFLDSKRKLYHNSDMHHNMATVEDHLQRWYDEYEHRRLEMH